jgi:CRISPR-associated endonuclease/helicase Cas3
MTAPIWEVQRWLQREDPDPDASDLESATETEPARSRGEGRLVLVLRGKSSRVGCAADLQPGDTVVVPAGYGGWDEIGHKPLDAEEDWADRAYLGTRRRLRLRLHPETIRRWPETPFRERIEHLIKSGSEELEVEAVREALLRYRKELGEAGGHEMSSAWLLRALGKLEHRLVLTPYPSSDGNGPSGWIVEGRRRLSEEPPVPLDQHTNDVTQAVRMIASQLLPAFEKTYVWAAGWHDAGKSDIRFQGMLRGGNLMAARLAPKLLAKGASANAVRDRCCLPESFRHETLSFQMVQMVGRAPVAQEVDRELGLHLGPSHHGRCRPFAPVVVDGEPETVSFGGYTLDARERMVTAAHRLNSGVAERFWVLIRRYGWWGLAYHEALFRLGDWMASEEEGEGGMSQ